MQSLSSISLTQFRNYSLQSFQLNAKVVAISGNNGMGKTNLLDAVYYLCFTKSYFQSKEINNIQRGKEGFRLEGIFGEAPNQQKTSIIWKEGKKRVLENEVLVEKITQYIGTHTALMIAPDDIELINGSGVQRRKFFDGLLSQADNEYLKNLLQYQKVLEQRNAYLKQNEYPTNQSLLDVYDQQLANTGTYIIQKRMDCSSILPQMVREFYGIIAERQEDIEVAYMPCVANADALLDALKNNRYRDIESRRTGLGIHSEDWSLTLDGLPYKSHASQGQKKSLLVSLKLAQLEWLRKLGKTPMVLLDDMFEKLDAERIQRLFKLLSSLEIPQIFMTHTSAEDMQKSLLPHFDDIKYIEL